MNKFIVAHLLRLFHAAMNVGLSPPRNIPSVKYFQFRRYAHKFIRCTDFLYLFALAEPFFFNDYCYDYGYSYEYCY